jgi:hypothetical protein
MVKRKDRQTIPWSKEKKRKDRQTIPWSKEKKRQTDKQYHGQKKSKDRQTIPWSKEKKRPWYCLSVFSLTMVLFVCLYFSFDHGIVCLSLLFF